MAVGAVNNGSDPYVQEINSGGNDAAQLQQQKEILQKQLEAVKSKPKNSQAEQDAAVKQIKQLKEKIAEIDQKIQKMSQNQQQGQNASGTSAAVNLKKEALSQSNSLSASVQNEQSVLNNMQQDGTQKQGLGNKSKTTDKLLDTYA